MSCPGSCAEAGRLRRHIVQLQMEVAEASVQLQNLQKDNEHLKRMVQAQSSPYTASKEEEVIGKLQMEVAEAAVLLRNLRKDNEHLKRMVQAQSSSHTALKDEEVIGKNQITSMLPYPVRVQIYEDIGGSDGDFLKRSGVPSSVKMAALEEEVIGKNQIRPMLPTHVCM